MGSRATHFSCPWRKSHRHFQKETVYAPQCAGISRTFVLQTPENAGQDFGLGALNNAEISRLFVFHAPKHVGIPKIFVIWALKKLRYPGFFNGFVLPCRVLNRRPIGLRDCATLHDRHSTSEPHNNGGGLRQNEQPTKVPQNCLENYVFVKNNSPKIIFRNLLR